MITADGARIPLSTIAHYENSLEDDRVSHEGQFASESIAFDMAEGVTVEQGSAAIERAIAKVGLPEDVIAKMAGTADAFAATQKSQPWMILGRAGGGCIWCLGVLYESYIHPLTILSTLPSAGVGALLSIYALGGEFSLISLLGLFLLIGVVKKNAILMIDLALQARTRIRAWRRWNRFAAPVATFAADPDDHLGGDPRCLAVAARAAPKARKCAGRWA